MNQYSADEINLMPFRQKQRTRSLWYGMILLALSILLARVVLMSAEFVVDHLSQAQHAKNDLLVSQNQVLQQQVVGLSVWHKKQHNRQHLLFYLKNKIASSGDPKISAASVNFLTRIKDNLPVGVELNQVHQHGNYIRLTGTAVSNAAMTNFMHSLAVPLLGATMPFFELKQRGFRVIFTLEVQLHA